MIILHIKHFKSYIIIQFWTFVKWVKSFTYLLLKNKYINIWFWNDNGYHEYDIFMGADHWKLKLIISCYSSLGFSAITPTTVQIIYDASSNIEF